MGTRHVAALTHCGIVRKRNEDMLAIDARLYGGGMNDPLHFELDHGRHIVAIADGMGGHAHGDIASRHALEALVANIGLLDTAASCVDAINRANDSLYDLMRLQPETIGMGTTIVGIALEKSTLICFNVGDSRAYRYMNGKLDRLSQDDVLRAKNVGESRKSHLITQSLGGHTSRRRVAPHVAVEPIAPGEIFLLCSDGLTDMVSEDRILAVLDAELEARQSVGTLLSLALQAGGIDNVTIAIVHA